MIRRVLMTVACVAALRTEARGEFDRHGELHGSLSKGPKMELLRATFFGTASAEEFVGVTVTPDGKIAVAGNSWGPPFPGYMPCEVLGPDQPWDVPLRRGTEEAAGPAADNPNRTGFLVFYSGDLKKAERAVRFGWGTADISATCAMKDGSLVIAGRATRQFRDATAAVAKRGVFPAGTNEWYGPVEYAGEWLPGDAYVARLDADLRTFRWVWILEGHRVPPRRVSEGKDGQVVFLCAGLKRIPADGSKVMGYEGTDLEKKGNYFRAVHPKDGSILVGSSWQTSTGREPWKMPWLQVYTAEGRAKTGYYTWPGRLVGHDDFRLVSDSQVRDVTILPSGDVALTGWSDGGNTVFCRHPADLEKALPEVGLGMSSWGAGVLSLAHVVRFSLEDMSDAYHTLWASFLQTVPNSISIEGICGARDGSVVLFGQSGGWLVQTTTEWYRAPEQYLVKTRNNKRTSERLYRANGWPEWQGLGGRGGYVSVLSKTLDAMYWSSATAMCDPVEVTECGSRYVVVGRSRGYNRRDGRTFCLLGHDIADWPGFLKKLMGPGSGARRFWDRMDEGTRLAVKGWSGGAVTAELREAVKASLDRVLSDARDLYSAEAWKADILEPHERRLVGELQAGTIRRDDLGDLNRRLLERTFPEHVFPSPKNNLAPVKDAVQGDYGGGASDGHVYLVGWPEKGNADKGGR